MLAAVLGLRHAAADWLEDLGTPEFRDQQAEGVAARRGIGTHKASGACAALNQARQLQFPQGAIHRGPGSVKVLNQL